ncbi:hypothetical protein JCM19000A_37080 [Silvimonas sp. JCM 19000]
MSDKSEKSGGGAAAHKKCPGTRGINGTGTAWGRWLITQSAHGARRGGVCRALVGMESLEPRYGLKKGGADQAAWAGNPPSNLSSVNG